MAQYTEHCDEQRGNRKEILNEESRPVCIDVICIPIVIESLGSPYRENHDSRYKDGVSYIYDLRVFSKARFILEKILKIKIEAKQYSKAEKVIQELGGPDQLPEISVGIVLVQIVETASEVIPEAVSVKRRNSS